MMSMDNWETDLFNKYNGDYWDEVEGRLKNRYEDEDDEEEEVK